MKKKEKTNKLDEILKKVENDEWADLKEKIALIDARGTYPPKTTKSMAEYTERLKEGKIRQPNFNTVRKNIRQFEEDNKPLF